MLLAVPEGSQLLTKDGLLDAVSVLRATKFVGVYFSTHWCACSSACRTDHCVSPKYLVRQILSFCCRCQPCRAFGKTLAKWYKANAKKLDIEIVFASSDTNETAFDKVSNDLELA